MADRPNYFFEARIHRTLERVFGCSLSGSLYPLCLVGLCRIYLANDGFSGQRAVQSSGLDFRDQAGHLSSDRGLGFNRVKLGFGLVITYPWTRSSRGSLLAVIVRNTTK
jgi:hypothetical protein